VKMAPHDEEAKKYRVGRKLTKKARPPHRLPSAHIPERLRDGDDAQEDVTAPVKGAHGPPQYMNQSVFSMIAAAGSRTDFNARFDESSDSEDEQGAKWRMQRTSRFRKEACRKIFSRALKQ